MWRATALCFILLAGTAWSADTSDPDVHAKPGFIGLFSLAEGQCWSVAFAGPAVREEATRDAAKERFEEPSAEVLALARRPVVGVHAWPKSEMRCGDETPQAVVVRDEKDEETVAKLVLTIKTSQRSNAYGASKTFGEGNAELTFEAFRDLFPGATRWVYLVTSDGRRGGWRIRREGLLVTDPDAWERTQAAERQKEVRARFASVCTAGATGSEPLTALIWLKISIEKEPGDVVEAAKAYPGCLESLRTGRDKAMSQEAGKLLAKIERER